MTTPGGSGSGNFEYTDDSVIARVAFDIPGSAVSDISQIAQVMGAMRTELEATARAQSDWLDYLAQVPQIAERANQAFRDQITLLERISYLQGEISPMSSSAAAGTAEPGGGTPVTGAAAGQGVASYSTAAAPGYINPFTGMVEGTGTGTNTNVALGQLAADLGEGSRPVGEMMAARGMSINPALLGSIGGAIAGALGSPTGAEGGAEGTPNASGNTGPQTTAPGRNSSKPPDAGAGGAPTGGQDPNQPNSGEQGGFFQSMIGSAWDQAKNMANGTRLGAAFGAAAGAFGKLKPPGDSGLLSKTLGRAGMVGGAVGLGALAFNKTQDIGERITRLQQLGSMEGGDWTTGIKEDLNARFQALDPFISTEEARKAIAIPMQAGFQGESRDELRDLLINNFKELGISMADSMKFEMANLQGVDLTDENVKESRTSNEAFLNTLKEMAGDGGNTMSLEQRKQQALELQTMLASMGVGQESQQRAAIGFQQGYDDSLALRGDMARIGGQTMNSGTLMTMVAQRHGITGIMPDALPDVMAEMGIDADEAAEEAYAYAAQMVSGLQPEAQRISAFRRLLGDQGVELTYAQAKDLYRKTTGSKGDKPTTQANKRAAEMGQKNQQSNWNPISGIMDTLSPLREALTIGGGEKWSDVPGDMWDAFMGRHKPSDNAKKMEESFARAGRIPGGGDFDPAGQKARALPQNMPQMAQTVTTKGQVQGEVRITVDQQGRVSAPPSIQLSGTQQAVNYGMGSAQLNNAPPGDPLHRHAFTGFLGG